MTHSECNLLFVYGTLLSQAGDDMGRPMRSRLACESRLLGPATVVGQLLDFGAYPGLIDNGKSDALVHGEVVELDDPTMSLVWLDEYEGINSARPYANEYERAIRQVTLDGEPVAAWVYLRIKLPSTGGKIIADGRWLEKPITS